MPVELRSGREGTHGLAFVTEGEDKPLKYPSIFHTADIAVITKIDLAQVVEFSIESARPNIQTVRPGMPVFEVSAKTGAGLIDVLGWMKDFAVT